MESESESDVIIPREWNHLNWKYAETSYELWRSLETPDSPPGVRLYNIMGEKRFFSTPFDLEYVKAVPDIRELKEATPTWGYSHGDGTVPRQSASNPMYPRSITKNHMLLHTDHTGLLRHPRVMGLLKAVTGTSCPWDGFWPLGQGVNRRIVRFFSSGPNVHARLEGDALFVGKSIGNQLEGRMYGTTGRRDRGLSLHTVSATYSLPVSAGWGDASSDEVWLMRKALAWTLLCDIEEGNALDKKIPCREPSWRGAAEATTVPDENLDLTAGSPFLNYD